IKSKRGKIMMHADNEITLSGVSKSYGSKVVLSNINLKIKRGEFVAIVGKSGCGKSTLLRLIAQLDRPSAGKVYVPNGKIIRMLFQDGRLLPWKTVKENVMLGLHYN